MTTNGKDNLILIHCDNQFLTTSDCQVVFPMDYLSTLSSHDSKVIPLGLWDGAIIQLVIIKHKIAPPLSNTQWQSLRPLMLQVEVALFRLLALASQIANWMIDNQFCSRCATPMQQSNEQHRMDCKACGYFAYPRLNPSMIVLVTKGDEILLARSPHFTLNMYSTLAGFVEIGESVEQCVRREVLEEVGISINNLRYIASQNWPYPNSLMLGYHATYEAGEIIPQAGEIEDAQWFNIKKLPDLPPKQAISRYLIDLYVAERLAAPQPALPY